MCKSAHCDHDAFTGVVNTHCDVSAVLFQDCLALGVIFAATDSVAVLQVLKQDRSPLLYSLVFGEGVINDATAVALLRAVQVSISLAHARRHE